ncbi:Uncharacterised protein [Serratia rubidaea]|uniref:Uncharacterized protein n=1 Tax=Serratia rubidaea TaxID=61652 RepID=A0A3S4FT04_SERRU|nr:Uncharacterised protein [Serratia rubidaea]
MSNQQAADDIILNGITLKAANRDVILSTKRFTMRKNSSHS